jgi:signal recognition particle subunit SRP68
LSLLCCRTIYEKLAGAVVDDSREVYQLKCDEIVPSIRYCSYNIGDKSAINDLMQMRGKAGAEDAMTSKLDVGDT